jgi:hypothetical protein
MERCFFGHSVIGLCSVMCIAWAMGIHGVVQMDKAIARLNIEQHRKLLANESDETRRATLLRLLFRGRGKVGRPSGSAQH